MERLDSPPINTFQELRTTFNTGPRKYDALVIATACVNKPITTPVTVIWDDWALLAPR
jgi:hypothetical protein